ncbi:MAG: ligase-associated DNA damage response endonuclease PdeM [Chloroflexi bacterium]|jgi:DNA ligase-associated metallophosphoesterase|uniref:DEAD/DEAH box helicase n=1 Tax=Candidatus Thermofonsia Clade 3 bacterium TaxID=2364212 RepID=A0A2M8QAP5_9CHLR|nr:ligase-associated DNA damage response endonuclease PdeM [Candidatus Roseilinea sp. NK_OTU-006]PJF46871.1 MAG: DEAD/DEAH box helicase [Candidatus Thermofonsia Clade 3 bacterium]RMG64569.1 MAG: ligase-associated DNA damage response endonuclease PdeM [Chloroflexota bacterium]
MVTIIAAGEVLQLWPERAVFWPRRGTLFVADVHFGKAAAFRSAGIPVPEGGLADDLQRLSQLIAATDAARVVFLGDVLHARRGRTSAVVAGVAAWRAQYSHRQFLIVKGNHDKQAGNPPTEWEMNCADEPFIDPPFAFRHTPAKSTAHYVLAGHVHPAIRLRGRAGLREKLACFVVGSKSMILPAFGSFTGTTAIRPGPDDGIYAIAGNTLIRLTGPHAKGE